jgi:predicted ArsR family transcriptional regulator
MLRRLQADGPATATECARIAGVTPSAASYHLRQLARYGFVGPAPSRGDRRERIWQSLIRGYRIDEVESDGPAMLEAELELQRATAESSDDLLHRWLARLPHEPLAWRAASMIGTKTIRANAHELGTLFERIAELIHPYLANRRTAAEAPADARLIHVDLRMFPWEDPPTLRITPDSQPDGDPEPA